ncbi:MAG: hypothetical protein RLZZ540_797 [Bacteroidota bacterium]|jgi:hypothetical protein
MSARTIDKAGTAVGKAARDASNFVTGNIRSFFKSIFGGKKSSGPPPNMGTNVNMNSYTSGGGSNSFGQGSFSNGFGDGFNAGVGGTIGFFKSLGTAEGWQAVGDGFTNIGLAACLICPEGSDTRTQMVNPIARTCRM